jgi:hypothetical protein
VTTDSRRQLRHLRDPHQRVDCGRLIVAFHFG